MKTFQEFFAEAEISGFARVTRGAAPAQATTASIRGAVDRALANSGQAQSASSKKGGMKTTVSGNVNVSGKFKIGGSKKSEKKKPEPESETRKPREVTKPTARRPREVTQGGSGTPQKGTKIYIKDKTGIRQTSLRDMTARERAGVMPHLTGGSSGMPTAVIRNVSSNRRPTVDKIYQSSTGSTPLNQPTRRQSSTGRAPRQVSQQSSTGRAPRQVSQPSQPSSLGRRSLRGF